MTILICNECDKPIPHPQLTIWKFRDGFCHCQPERSKREEPMCRCSFCGESWHTKEECQGCNHCGNHRRYAVL